MNDWRARVALGAVLAVAAGLLVTLLYGHYAGRLLDWRRAVSSEQAAERRAAERERAREQAVADSIADAALVPPANPAENSR